MQSSKDSQVTISPNLLKNFNVYGILQPLKNGSNIGENSGDLKVDKLIDIDDCSQDSGIQDCDLNPSFLDQNREFSLVDLYQNIFVTPQHLKQKQAVKEVPITNPDSKAFDIDLKQFLDKYESGQKVDCTKKTEEAKSEHDYDVLVDKPRVLEPKVFMEPDSDPEDLINEILTQKIMEKRMLDEVNHSRSLKPESSKKIENTNIVTDFPRLRLNSANKNSKLENHNNENEPRPSNFKTPPMNSQINNSLSSFVVRSMQKDDKLYKKNRVVKPERLTCSYTKGPDFNEKSIVLPQIMARLNARRDYLDEINNQKKRLILDTGSHVKAESTFLNGNEKLKNNSNVQGTRMNSVKPDHVPNNKDPKLCMNWATGSISVHSIANPCTNCNHAGSKNPNNNGAGASTSVNELKDFGKVSPTVLMEDCNKERLKALKRSQMIKNFVFTGKFEP